MPIAATRSVLRTLARAVIGVSAVAAAAVTAVAPAAAQGLPLIRDTEIENLLNDYAQPIFKAAGVGGGRVQMRVVRDESFNAFVMDGRNVFMHTGTLMQSDTPNQVIGVIAHETGHISGAHPVQLQTDIQNASLQILLLRVLGIGAAIASKKGEAIAAADELVIRSFLNKRRSQEGAADQAGLDFLKATKQSGNGMLETFERFAQQEYISDTYKDPYVRSHPIATDRLARLRKRVAESPFTPVKDTPEMQLRHDMMRAKLAGYLTSPTAVFNKYPPADQSFPARYARAIAKFFRGGPGALEAALVDIDGLIREKPNNPYFYELKADFLARSGRQVDAIPLLRQALKLLGGSAPQIQVQLARALVASKQPAALPEATDMLRRSVVVDPESSAYRALADASYQLGKAPEADAYIAQAHLLEGNFKEAKIFATRAKRGLAANSPLWIKMDDILRLKAEDQG